MAKHKDDKDEDAGPASNATVKGEAPKPAGKDGASTEGHPKGSTRYPPSPSDSAGEKTDNIAPSRLLPPDVPESENPPAREDVPTAAQGIAAADAEVVRLKAENAALKKQVIDLGGMVAGETTAKSAKGKRKAWVTPAGGHRVEVEIASDTPEAARDSAAIAAYQQRTGVWSLPNQPHVDHTEKKE